MHPRSHMANFDDEFWHKCRTIDKGVYPRNAPTGVEYFHAQENPGQCDTDFPDFPATIVRASKWQSHES